MSDKSATNSLTEAVGADPDVTVGQNVVDGLRWKFATTGKMQRGDFYITESLGLLRRIFPMIGHLDQERLWATYTRAKKANAGLKNASHLGVRRFFKALEYERRSKKAFKLIIKTSSQVLDNDLMSQIEEAIHSRYRTVFSAQVDGAIGTSDRVEVEAAPLDLPGEELFTLTPHGQDASLSGLLSTSNCSRIVLVDVDDSADSVEMRRLRRHPSCIADEIFSPYSDCEEEEEASSEEEVSSDEEASSDE